MLIRSFAAILGIHSFCFNTQISRIKFYNVESSVVWNWAYLRFVSLVSSCLEITDSPHFRDFDLGMYFTKVENCLRLHHNHLKSFPLLQYLTKITIIILTARLSGPPTFGCNLGTTFNRMSSFPAMYTTFQNKINSQPFFVIRASNRPGGGWNFFPSATTSDG